ncbi:nitroreductase family protein [Oceanobacillus sp. 143]|uniref:Nitroreductase family protein n=1 Tax=Oceanobacillus zhaokaii TaxID=2052660 RepID=A0A345PDT1_9BACI|nr:nitroreductase family protein [Oceanobacillus zhaokaii]AXI08161.1 nitroreductase family protein [Oceanobacillus zhaokaii]QGS68111.1 nitroreductase family protein [Oceanobacillus sp. 143]
MMLTDVKTYRKPEFEIDEMFLNRWSPRSFSEKEVPTEILSSLFEAARWAPSAFNFQPWRFIVAKTNEERETFHSFISEFNLTWCKKAPVLSLIISKKAKDGAEFPTHSFDTGAAWGYLALQANKSGLVTHPMTGFDFQKAREVLEIPEDYAIEALVAIGYQDEKEKLPEKLQQREHPNERQSLQEFIFNGKFGSK